MKKTIPPPPTFLLHKRSPIIVNLNSKNGTARWTEAIEKEGSTAKNLFSTAWKQFPPVIKEYSEWFGDSYRYFEGPYQSEIQAWADAMGKDFGEVAMVNCAYELEQLSSSHSFADISTMVLQKLFGCSSGICKIGSELIHVRNLDWPISGMGKATRVFKFVKGGRTFFTVGFPGFVGVLSGMVPGAYSVTLNWAPPDRAPSFDHAPAFLLRQTLEECDTYAKAVTRLKRSKLSTSVFYTICGINPEDACVIERIPDDYFIRQATNGFLAQTNHHDEKGKFTKNNLKLKSLAHEDYLVETTKARKSTFEATLSTATKSLSKFDPETIFKTLDTGDVTNYETCQRMIFRPKTGEWFLQTSTP